MDGWRLGGGAETAFESFRIRLEYRYSDYGQLIHQDFQQASRFGAIRPWLVLCSIFSQNAFARAQIAKLRSPPLACRARSMRPTLPMPICTE
jgi:hypothetical protein